MTLERVAFGPATVLSADASKSELVPADVLSRFDDVQSRRHAALNGVAAQRFLVGRSLLASLVGEFTDRTELGFTTTCEWCGGPHGQPRLQGAPVVVSVSYAGSMVAVAAAALSEASGVGVDLEREPAQGRYRPLDELATLFAPAAPPDITGWTLREAALKADGRGLRVDVASVFVDEPGSGIIPGARAVRIPERYDVLEAAVIPGPDGFVLSAAIARAGGVPPRS